MLPNRFGRGFWAAFALASWALSVGAIQAEGDAVPKDISREEAAESITNPLPYDPDVIKSGKKHYLRHCQICHGFDGQAWITDWVMQFTRRGEPLPLDATNAEDRLGPLPSDDMTPEQIFEYRWGLTVLERAVERLRAESDGHTDDARASDERQDLYAQGAHDR